NNKITWIKWANVLASYEHGGLEFGSLKAFNLALLQKWRWRFVNNLELLWEKLMKAIHGLEEGFDGKGCYTHGIWANIVGSSIYLHSRNLIPNDALKCQIGCGSSIRFWKDLWIGDEPLCSRFNRLYRLDINENCTIRNKFVEGNWSWQWRRPVTSGRTEHMLNSLLYETQHLTLSSRPDTWKWSIGVDGLFAVGTTRAYYDQLLLPSLNIATRWNTCLPRKVNLFIWRLRLDKLPHRLNLSKRGLEIDFILCPICNNNVESNDHVFFSCYWVL
ncbi:RNA-directed DNA polymerase, eukaryota, reverse transcriptase zinc-binding domain protein, partial [Tanacetum coccineum]